MGFSSKINVRISFLILTFILVLFNQNCRGKTNDDNHYGIQNEKHIDSYLSDSSLTLRAEYNGESVARINYVLLRLDQNNGAFTSDGLPNYEIMPNIIPENGFEIENFREIRNPDKGSKLLICSIQRGIHRVEVKFEISLTDKSTINTVFLYPKTTKEPIGDFHTLTITSQDLIDISALKNEIMNSMGLEPDLILDVTEPPKFHEQEPKYSDDMINAFEAYGNHLRDILNDREVFDARIYQMTGTTFRAEIAKAKHNVSMTLTPMVNFQRQLSKIHNSWHKAIWDNYRQNVAAHEARENSKKLREEISLRVDPFFKSLENQMTQKKPIFKSNFLGDTEISFDKNDTGDVRAYKYYVKSFSEMNQLQFVSDRYHELIFAQQAIEIRQTNKDVASESIRNALNDIAEGVVEKSKDLIIEGLKGIFTIKEGFDGFQHSLVENYSLGLINFDNKESGAYRIGRLIGDAASMLVSSIQTISGITLALTSASSGAAALSLAVVPGGAAVAPLAIPISVGGVLKGAALSRHGFEVFKKSQENFFNKISTSENIDKVKKSQQRISELKPEGKIRISSSKEYNKEILNLYPDYKPPWWENFKTAKVKTSEDIKNVFVRVHTEGKQTGNWIMHKNDLIDVKTKKILTPHEIHKKFSLPKVPTHISEVHIPKGTNLNIGKVNNFQGGRSGAWQYRILHDGKIPNNWFVNTMELK